MRPPTALQTTEDYKYALLWLMNEMGPSATSDVCAEFNLRFGHLIPLDQLDITAGRGWPRWEAKLRYMRKTCVLEGLMDGRTKGVWSITAEGRQWLNNHP
jgi:Mrr N-terminal domain